MGFAPIALIIGIFPRGGHEFFRNWLGKLATAIFIKALYSLVIAVVIAVSAALSAATESLGFLFSFVLQAIFFWAIFLYRKEIAARLVSATTGAAHDTRNPGKTVVQRGADVAMRPFGALLAVPGRGVEPNRRQESALAGGAQRTDGTPGGPVSSGASGEDHDSPLVARASGNGQVAEPPHGSSATRNGRRVMASGDPLSPRQRAGASATEAGPGREAAGPEPDAAVGNGHAPRHQSVLDDRRGGGAVVVRVGSGQERQHSGDEHAPAAPVSASPPAAAPEDASPRASHEDVMRRARELRRRAELERGHPDRAA